MELRGLSLGFGFLRRTLEVLVTVVNPDCDIVTIATLDNRVLVH
jgi:hypothetical protein